MDFTRMTAYLDRFYQEKNIPGLGVAVYHRHVPVYQHYAGFSDVEAGIPFGPESIFRLYSATKVITCTAMLQLMERGLFGLDDPLSEFIPEYAHMRVRHSLPDGGEELREARGPILIRHLFSMSAGLGSRDVPSVQAAVEASGGEGKTLDVIRALAQEPLLFEPGTHFRYGACHDVLGALIEVLTGQSFEEYLQQSIFRPIGMADTSFTLRDESRFCKLYNRFNGKTHQAESIGETLTLQAGRAYQSGGGGLYSTVPDYSRFAETLCNDGLTAGGERILQRETIDLMRTPQLGEEAQKDFALFGGPSKHGYSYGLGVRTLVDRELNNSLSQNGEFGWDGARGCYVVIDPEEQLTLFYAQQEGGSPWYNWHGTVRNTAYASIWG